jgi:hypothetical protein
VRETRNSTEHSTKRLLNQKSSLEALEKWSQFYAGNNREDITPRSARKQLSQGNSYSSSAPSKSISRPEMEDLAAHQPSNLEALHSLLRRIGVQDDVNLAKSQSERVLASLTKKESRTKDLVRHLNKAIASPLTEDFGSTDKANQILLKNLHVDSDYALSLTNSVQTKQIRDLENQIQSIQQAIEGLEREKQGVNDTSRQKFVSRWS